MRKDDPSLKHPDANRHEPTARRGAEYPSPLLGGRIAQKIKHGGHGRVQETSYTLAETYKHMYIFCFILFVLLVLFFVYLCIYIYK